MVCFVLFGCIRDCLVALRNSVQIRAELLQKFLPRSRVGIFHNERTRSTPLDPKLTFWCVSYYLGAFGTVWLPHKTRCKTGRTSAKVCATKSRRNFSHRTHPILPIGPLKTFWCISYYLGAFGTVWLPDETRSKWAELVQKFVPRSRVGICRNECTRSTPLDTKLTFWCVSYHLGAFSQRTNTIHPVGPETDVLVRFVLFGCIRFCLFAVRNLVQTGPN